MAGGSLSFADAAGTDPILTVAFSPDGAVGGREIESSQWSRLVQHCHPDGDSAVRGSGPSPLMEEWSTPTSLSFGARLRVRWSGPTVQ
jgi:hypothetical protein